MESKQLGKFVWFFLLCWKCHFKHVLSSADGTFTCPGLWMDKYTYNLTCEVYTASVNATTCPGASGELSFRFTPYGGALLPYCTVSSYFDAGCDKTFNSKGCRCKEKTNNDIYVLEYMVTADVTTQMGGSWSCAPLCLDSYLFTVNKNITPVGNCTNVVIATTSTTAVTTVASAVTANSSTNSTEAPRPCGLCAWCIALIVLSPIFLLIGVVILVLIIIWICGWCQRAWKRKSDNQKTAWGIAGIIVAVLILALGVIAVIVASIKSETCEGWCCIANIVLGSFCIAIGLVIVILLILIMCECIKRKRKEQHENDNRAAERGNKTNLKKSKDTPLSETPSSGSGELQHTGLQSPKKKHKKKKHRDSEESSLHLSKLRSDSATSSESTSNGTNAIQSQPAPLLGTPRPLPVPNLTSVERNSALDLLPVLPVNKTLPPIMTNLKEFKEH